MGHREITNDQVLDAFMRVVAEEREWRRRELQQWRAKLDEEWRSALDEELQQSQSALHAKLDELQAAYEDKVRTLVAENGRLQQENNELRAECAELRETKGLLDYIKTQHAPDRPPQ